MFSNLIRLNFIRLYKSRVTSVCAYTALALMLLFAFMLFALFGEVFKNRFNGGADLSHFWISLFYIMSSSIVSVAEIVIVGFATCDYYKFRQMINIEGACRSKIKFCLSEIVAILLFSFVVALVPIAFAFLGDFLDIPRLEFFTTNFKGIAKSYFADIYMLFSAALPVFALSKIFRNKIEVAITVAVVPFVIELIVGSLVTFNIDVYVLFINPAGTFVDAILGEKTGISVYTAAIVAVIENVCWIALALVGSKRRFEL